MICPRCGLAQRHPPCHICSLYDDPEYRQEWERQCAAAMASMGTISVDYPELSMDLAGEVDVCLSA